jgi:hypothetical protein
MRHFVVAALGAAIVASGALPWLRLPFGHSLSPFGLVVDLPPEVWSDLPLGLILFGLSFVLPVFVVLRALGGQSDPGLQLIAGGLPIALIAWVAAGPLREMQAAGSPMGDLAGFSPFRDGLMDAVGIGPVVWAGAAVLLTVAGLRGLGRAVASRRVARP